MARWHCGFGVRQRGGRARGTVRQFVAMPIDSAASIEKQLVDKGLLDKARGGMRIEVFPMMKNFSCWIPRIRRTLKGKNGLDMTPRSLGMCEGSVPL